MLSASARRSSGQDSLLGSQMFNKKRRLGVHSATGKTAAELAKKRLEIEWRFKRWGVERSGG